MFWKIVLFEIQNRLRRPAIYIYILAIMVFTVVTFANGYLPLGEKQHINSPHTIAFWCAALSMMTMLVSSSVMGMALYRDIEFNTKDYYLTYPITKAGYYWGRYVGSFFFMLVMGLAILAGVLLGTKLGPAMGWKAAVQYGPNLLKFYMHPLLTIALPNLFFTSSLFYGLIALTRNVKVIYTGGILLFLGYFISLFFFGHTGNIRTMILSDPFLITGVRMEMNGSSFEQQNNQLIPIEGNLLVNRFIWVGLGLLMLLVSYLRFNFETFFSGKRDRAAPDEGRSKTQKPLAKKIAISFKGSYNRQTLAALTRLELSNIFRDNYFWIIIGAGALTLGFAFWTGSDNYWVESLPITSMLLSIFNDGFLFFLFFIILFYTGETLHRDRITRYAFINDSLPPPNWVLSGSKLIALLVLGAGLSLLPVIVGPIVQSIKGYYQFEFSIYWSNVITVFLPDLLEMVTLAYLLHIVINNKFAAHAVAVVLWVSFFLLDSTGTFNYHLLLYGHSPAPGFSAMDGLGHMAGPIAWFQGYWLLFGGLLIIIAALFYYRGVSSAFKERLRLVPERFDRKTRIAGVLVLVPFLVLGGYIYYNVNVLNDYLTKGESEERAAIYEKTLKHYDSLPQPKVTYIKMDADLFPDRQQQVVRSFVTLVNKTSRPITQLLLDGDELTEYSLYVQGKALSYASPLIYPRGIFNILRSRNDTAPFRLYQFQTPLASGDTTVLEIHSAIFYRGFANDRFGKEQVRNGSIFTGGLPEMGYDADDELHSPYVRKKYHLPEKTDEEIPQDDSVGISTLKAGKSMDLFSLDLTVSTSGDQSAIAPGRLIASWKKDGRNYFHYVQDQPGMYGPLAVLSAKYAVRTDSVLLDHPVAVQIYYDPRSSVNVPRFLAAYKTGLPYYSAAYGAYPSNVIRLAQATSYTPRKLSLMTLAAFNEYYAWDAHFVSPDQFDYCYYLAAQLLAQQWWRFQVAPNETTGSLDISEGLSTYGALVLIEKKYGRDNMRFILQQQLWPYLFLRRHQNDDEVPLIRANKWFEWEGKASVALYGLKDLLGEDSINAALREFRTDYGFKSQPPYAGANDLYRYLKRHTPDSLQYYLSDTWLKITLYDNKLEEWTAVPTGKNGEYKVTLKFGIHKIYFDGKGKETPASAMNDYIDIGIFGKNTKDKDGRSRTNPLLLKKYKFTAGTHTLTLFVTGKPIRAGIDPYSKLIDRQPDDNLKNF